MGEAAIGSLSSLGTMLARKRGGGWRLEAEPPSACFRILLLKFVLKGMFDCLLLYIMYMYTPKVCPEGDV